MPKKTPKPTTKPARPPLVVERIFNAPRALVFKAWTDPEHLARWWGPKGYTNPVCELDVRPSGAILIHMRSPEGAVIPINGVFDEITVPDRLVFTLRNFPDETGQPQLEINYTVSFAQDGKNTKVTLRAVITKSTPAVSASLEEMEAGWNQSLDRLTASLEQPD
jgi:uncharacterized protein YndB with AHSA1/START domain